MKKYILILFAAVLVLAGWAWCDYSVLSSRTNIDELSQQIRENERKLPDSITEIFGKLDVLRTDVTSTRRLVLKCKNTQGMSNVEIQLHEGTWKLLAPFVLDRTSQFAIYAHLLPFAKGEGLSYGAQLYFSKNISDLTEDEILTLLVISKSPTRFSPIDGNKELNDNVEKLRKMLN